MDVESYDSLFLRIKDSLTYSTDLSENVFIASHFSSTLIECNSCVSKAFGLATKLLEENNIQISKLCDYIDNAIILLQMLSDYIKNALESASMACCNMKPFPITTGNIILTVFLHCKDSEWIYGQHLKSVEIQLKDLFRTCHELQLTYLMTIEKHFIFDLNEKEEQEILIEALNINMKIGEIVQALDIKTMAEQWKAYTVICEKYSNFLLDKNIFNKCTQLFAAIIMNNIKAAMECAHDNKGVVRSLKVANFTIKILSRVSGVFIHAITNNYEHVIELMEYIYMHNPAYLKQSADKTEQFVNLVLSNILIPTDALCNILLQDERFLDTIHEVNVKTLETNAYLGHTLLIISLIKTLVQRKEDQVLNMDNRKLIDCVYRILPLGHYWFNMGLRFPTKDSSGSEKYLTLYEQLIVHVVAVATTFTAEEYVELETYMLEGIMGSDCYSAMFSSNLWVLLLRTTNDHLTLNTLCSLVNMYQKMEKHWAFANSPQKVHLSCFIAKLFEATSRENKMIMSKRFQPSSAVWSILKVSNLPDPIRRNIEAVVFENFRASFSEVFETQDGTEKGMDRLIQIMKVASTCRFVEIDSIDEYIVKLWARVCHKNIYIQSDGFNMAENIWFLKYLEALVALTDCMIFKLNSSSIGKILHNMSTLLCSFNTEMTILLVNLFCKLTFNCTEDENKHVIDDIFKETWKVLLQGVEAWTKPYLLIVLIKYGYHEKFQEIMSIMLGENESLNEFNADGTVKSNCKNSERNQQLLKEAHYEYVHKCRKNIVDYCKENDVIHSTKSNFDLGGFMFDDEVEEPSRKKAKLDIETDSLVESLEHNTSLLCQVDHRDLCNHRNRIADVIDKLRNILS